MLMPFLLICCKGSKNLDNNSTKSSDLVPNNEDVAVAQSKWPGTTLMNLTTGYDIFSDKCTRCHETKMPQDFSVDDWNSILPGMGRRARLDSNQYKLVYQYILTKRETVLGGKK